MPPKVRMRNLLLMISWDFVFVLDAKTKQKQCCCAGCRWSMRRSSLLLRTEQNKHHPAIIGALKNIFWLSWILSFVQIARQITSSFRQYMDCGCIFSLSDTEWREWQDAIVLTVVSCCRQLWQLKHCQRKEFCSANWTISNVGCSTGQSSQCPGQVVPLVM